MTNTMKLKNKKGFTLTELIVVIVIIGILAAVLIPSLTGYITKANKSAAEQEASSYIEAHSAWLFEKEAGTIESTVEFSTYAATLVEHSGTTSPIIEGNEKGFVYCNGKYCVKWDKTSTLSSKFSTSAHNGDAHTQTFSTSAGE